MYRKTAIVGIGSTEFSKNSGRSEWELALEAILAALADAGVEPAEVDGIVRFAYDNVTHPMLVRALGIRDLRWYGDIPLGGTAQCGVIAQASAAIVAGLAKTVIVFRSLNERSGVRYGRAERNIAATGDQVEASGDRTPSGQFSGPYGLHAPGQVQAMWCQRYMHEASATAEQMTDALATVAIQQRQYARTNPMAMMRDKPLDADIYRAGRMISAPLRLYDYCLESDGAIALVITGAEHARSLRSDPTYILAAQQSLYPHSESMTVYADSITRFPAAGNIDKLYRDARITAGDISCAQLYDATSFAVVVGLETYGFAPHGQAWRHLLEQGIGPNSTTPVNTHGGHLSEGYIHGMNHLTEAVRQLRGTAANPIQGAQIALVGCSMDSSAILGNG